MMTTHSAPVAADVRLLGVVVAAFICAFVIIGGAVVDPPGGWVVGMIGLPTTLVLSWGFAPELIATSRRQAVAIGLWFGAKTILLTDALIVGIGIVPAAIAGLPWVVTDHHPLSWPIFLIAGLVALVVLAAVVFAIGAAIVGIPVSFVVLPAALVWAFLLRAFLRVCPIRRLEPEPTGS